MFYKSDFNQDISKWDVSRVVNMYAMFHSSEFNQDISQWNIRNVSNMDSMFIKSKFSKDLFNWKNILNRNVSMAYFNENSLHEKLFGTINRYNDFQNMKSLDNIIKEKIDIIRSIDSDKGKYQALKDLKTVIELTGYKIDRDIEISINTLT